MKVIRYSNKQRRRGSVLAITLIISGIMGTLMGSYLYLVETQRISVARAQAWNRSVVVAEAGVEEAMALLNSGVSSPNFAIFPWTSSGGAPKVGGISLASSTPSRPLVPAPT